MKRGIERGVEGFIANYFYTNGCMCQYCVRGFKDSLRQRYSPAELRKQFGIEDLDKHRFTEIIDWYEPNKMTPLRLEELRFSDTSRKKAFDEIFIKCGRSLKPDLMVAQWVHSHVPMPSDSERFMLPPALWAKGEDYLWYSLGTGSSTILQLRYIRGAGSDRPYSGHYGNLQSRALMAELCANGGSPNVRHLDFNDAELRGELVRLFQFMKQHDDVYRGSASGGECVLLYPRSQFQQGCYTNAVWAFEGVGRHLLNGHVLFDVLPDDIATPHKLARYKRIFTISSMPEMEAESYGGLSRFEAPSTVCVSASHPEKGSIWDIHFVNFNRKELSEKELTGRIEDEKPIPVSGVKADLVTPDGFSISKIKWMSPESPELQELRIEKAGNCVRFTAPEFLVYGVARVYLTSEDVAGGQSAAQRLSESANSSTGQRVPVPHSYKSVQKAYCSVATALYAYVRRQHQPVHGSLAALQDASFTFVVNASLGYKGLSWE